MSESLSTRQKVALAAALGAGVVVGATGLVIYQRLSQNVGLRVTGEDFSQEIASLNTHIERLRHDIETLKVSVAAAEPEVTSGRPLKSALKKSSRYPREEEDTSLTSQELTVPPAVPSAGAGARHRRNLSWGSGLTSGSASSSGTEYFSAISSEDEEFTTPPDVELGPGPALGYEEAGLVELFAKLDDLMEGSQEQQQLALQLVTESLAEHNSNPSIVWRLCKVPQLLGGKFVVTISY